MTNSLLPAGTRIRVLTTIENGVTTHETISDDADILPLKEFVTLARQAGYFVSKHHPVTLQKKALKQIEMMRKIISEGLEDLDGIDVVSTLCELHEEVMDIERQLKELSPGE
ncbi:hypothetical protein [Citrobacter arsenatis]|uniref:hypothetical protein n=1 Tax=Citrobacter arsenatis TaxID=2546350 RepID=UPI00300E3692